MSHRIDVNELAARLALTIDTPVALPPAWVAKQSEGLGGQIIARNLLAVLVIGTDRRWYSVAGTPAKACLTIETSAAAVSILLNGHDPVWSGRTPTDLHAKVSGFLDGLVLLAKLGHVVEPPKAAAPPTPPTRPGVDAFMSDLLDATKAG